VLRLRSPIVGSVLWTKRARDCQIKVIARVFARCGDSKKPEVAELLVQMFYMRRNGVIATAIERMGFTLLGRSAA
jgi:hypothetical protein